jgi:hypothetical protein
LGLALRESEGSFRQHILVGRKTSSCLMFIEGVEAALPALIAWAR